MVHYFIFSFWFFLLKVCTCTEISDSLIIFTINYNSMQIDVLKNSLWTTEIKEIRKNNYDVTLANIFTPNAPKVYSARMMTITWKLHEHVFLQYSYVQLWLYVSRGFLSNARNCQSTHLAYSIFARLSLHAFNFDNRRNNYTRWTTWLKCVASVWWMMKWAHS